MRRQGGSVMLQLHSVCKNFGGLPALSDVSFHAPKGQLTALIGPNGAGKSTLINCITGVLQCHQWFCDL